MSIGRRAILLAGDLAAPTATRVPSPPSSGTLVCSLESPASSLNGFKTEKPERGLPETGTLPLGNPTAAESNLAINSLIGTGPDRIKASFFDCHYGFGERLGQGITLALRLRGSPKPLKNFQQCEHCHFISLAFC
jgi:hypothetical protein